jgi:RHS repeat-associated protein
MKTWIDHYAKAVCRRAGTWALLCLALLTQVQARAQTVEYIHTDALGSPIAVTDANQNVIERSEYAPYGDLLNRPDADGPGYTGHVLDAATGLNYMQQRYYDPVLGIFLSGDPVTAFSDPVTMFNRYRYANGNPYRFKDPDGRKCTTADAKSACTFDEFRDKSEKLITRDQALSSGSGVAKMLGIDRGSKILRAEAAMTTKYLAAIALAAKGGGVTISGSQSLGIPDQNVSGSTIVGRMETIKAIAYEGPSPDSRPGYKVLGGVPATADGSASNGPMRLWSDGAGINVGQMYGHEILHTIYSGASLPNRGWANPAFQLQHQAPFDEASDDIK